MDSRMEEIPETVFSFWDKSWNTQENTVFFKE